MIINLISTFSPLFLSSGSVFFISRLYAQKGLTLWAVLAIVVWCISECCLGLSLLGFLHSVKRADKTTTAAYIGYMNVVLIPILWFSVSLAIITRSFGIATAISFVNFIAHFLLIGVVMAETSSGVAILVVLGSAWVFWTCCFSAAFLLYVRKGAMKRYSDAAAQQFRVRSYLSNRDDNGSARTV